MTDERTITQFCICEVEFCYCSNTTELSLVAAAGGVEWECDECKAGHHVMSPDGPRT
jgi:hypothetical protein